MCRGEGNFQVSCVFIVRGSACAASMIRMAILNRLDEDVTCGYTRNKTLWKCVD